MVEVYLNKNWKTEVVNGRETVMPKDWKVILFSNLFNSRMGETILKKDLDIEGNIPVYSATKEDDFFGFLNESKVKLKESDLIIPARGNLGFIKKAINNSTGTQTTILAMSISGDIELSNYIYYYLMYLKKNKVLFNLEGGAIPQLTVKEVNKFEIASGTTFEKKQIANLLTKQENLISKKERLIELKEKELKYLEQELLSGRLRIDENGRFYRNTKWKKVKINGRTQKIPVNWEIEKLKNLFKKTKGKNSKKTQERGDIPIISANSIDNYNYTIFAKDGIPIEKEEIIILWDGENAGKVGINHMGFLPSTAAKLTKITNINTTYVYYYLKKSESYIKKNREGSTIPHINKDFLNIFGVILPKIEEQNKIAKILTTINEAIQRRKEEIKLEKKKFTYLQQELLSGRIRIR